MRKQFSLLLAVVLVVIVVAVINRGSTNAVPETTFSTITGKKITLRELRGKPVIVTFWATDCASCMKEIPQLIALYQQYHQQGLEIIAVAMAYDPPNHVLDMAKAQQLPYHVTLDMQAENAHVFGDVSLTPTTFLIAPDGTIVLQKTGLFDLINMKTQLSNFIKG
jgi:peroxiredoxin